MNKSYTTVESAKLDKQLRNVAKTLRNQYADQYDFSWGHNKKSPLWEGQGIQEGFMPDGGAWLLKGTTQLKVAFEAKHQQNAGNACERMHKNINISKWAGVERYVTFMTGEGAEEDGVLYKAAFTALTILNPPEHQAMNVVHSMGFSFFLKPEGFTEQEIETIFVEALK